MRPISDHPVVDGWKPVTSGPDMVSVPLANMSRPPVTMTTPPPTTAMRLPTKSLVIVDFDMVVSFLRS